MTRLPPVMLGAILLGSFTVALLIRRPLERRLVASAVDSARPKRQFFLDLGLSLIAGVLAGVFNGIVFGFPVGSSLTLLIGCLAAGFFMSLDTALARERRVIVDAATRDSDHPIPRRLYSITRRFSLTALAAVLLFSIVFILVLGRDIVWLSALGAEPAALADARDAVAYEVFFVMAVMLVLVINLIISYSKNLNLLFANETDVLERVSRGDLSRKVPVATHDEFGFIAGHTNVMIDGLRHRMSLMDALKIAEEVQRNLLPQDAPQWYGLDVAGASLYCEEIGGDYYDFFTLAERKAAVVVADASGHGIGAAMQMTAMRAFLHSAMRDYAGPTNLVNSVNRHLSRDSRHTSLFVSLLFLELDMTAKGLRWVRAGQEPAILYDPAADHFSELTGEGMALGVVADYPYQTYTRQNWSRGTIIVMTTDGVHETRNGDDEMFGSQRLRQVVRDHAAQPAETIQNELITALQRFRGTSSQEDDLTLVVIKLL
jgi:sigma-B regulation protein RsbU (phosphoserine phosphatase)